MNGQVTNPLVLVIDAHPWIEKVDAHLSSAPECLNGKVVTADLIVGDAFKTVLKNMGDCYDYNHFDAMDYIFSAIDEVNPSLIVTDSVYELIQGWLNEAMEISVAGVYPFAKIVADSDLYKNAGYWNIYRVSNTRLVVEVGDGSRTFDQYYFRQDSLLRKDGALEDHWIVQ